MALFAYPKSSYKVFYRWHCGRVLLAYDEARRLAAELELLGRHHTAAIRVHALDADEEDVEISWIFNLDLALENHDAARAGNQAGNYEELMALDEFTTGLTGENDSNMTVR